MAFIRLKTWINIPVQCLKINWQSARLQTSMNLVDLSITFFQGIFHFPNSSKIDSSRVAGGLRIRAPVCVWTCSTFYILHSSDAFNTIEVPWINWMMSIFHHLTNEHNVYIARNNLSGYAHHASGFCVRIAIESGQWMSSTVNMGAISIVGKTSTQFFTCKLHNIAWTVPHFLTLVDDYCCWPTMLCISGYYM